MLKRSYPGYLVVALGVFSLAGWGMAWRNSGGKAGAAEGDGGRTRASSSATGRDGGRGDAARVSIGSLLENPRSAKLFTEIGEISTSAVPGQVNERLIAACRASLTDPDPLSRARDFALLLTQMRAEDGAAMHRLFLELDAQGKPLIEYSSFAMRWGEVDGGGALRHLMEEVPLRMPERDVRLIVRGWGTKDPQGALAWMAENEEVAENYNGRGRVFEGWVRNDSDGATAWLLKQKPGRDVINCVAGAMPEQLLSKDVRTAVKWLADLPDDGLMGVASQQGWRTAIDNLHELSYQSASGVWAEVSGEPWAGFEQFAHLADRTSKTRSAAEGLGGFLNELSNSWPAEDVTKSFRQWSERNPEQVSGWLAEAPDSPVRTAAIHGLIKTLEKSDPAAAEQWRRAVE